MTDLGLRVRSGLLNGDIEIKQKFCTFCKREIFRSSIEHVKTMI